VQKRIDIEAIALQFNDCINSRDIEKLTDLMTENHVFIDMEGNRIEGVSNARDMAWKPFFLLFPDYRNIFERVVVKGSKVIMQGYSVCRDKRLDNLRAIWVAEIREDKVGLWQIYPDTEENRVFFNI
jgi:ketosteroid isomerase-like protein